MRKRSAGYRPLITEPADAPSPSAATPSIDETKFEKKARGANPRPA
jgi:hypothetical protein